MSEVILAGIIGGTIGVVSSVACLIIQGHFSKRTTEMQIYARIAEQERQFEYQNKQAQISRLVEVRAQYLNLLRELIAKCYESADQTIKQIGGIEARYGNPPVPDKLSFLETTDVYQGMVNKLSEIVEELNKAIGEAYVLRSKSGDRALAQLINNVSYEASLLNLDIGQQKNAFARWAKVPDEKMQVNLEGTRDKAAGILTKLGDINSRIELLLSGRE